MKTSLIFLGDFFLQTFMIKFENEKAHLSYTLVHTSRAYTYRHQATHTRRHFHNVCYTPLRKHKGNDTQSLWTKFFVFRNSEIWKCLLTSFTSWSHVAVRASAVISGQTAATVLTRRITAGWETRCVNSYNILWNPQNMHIM